MLHIERFQCNMLSENCYVVSDETKECVIIDCGAFYPEERKAIPDYITGNGLNPIHLLVTTTLATTPSIRLSDSNPRWHRQTNI